MATILREWSYRYQWLYDGFSRLAALSVGGEARFRQLALEGISVIPEMQILDLCCGSGQTTYYLVKRFQGSASESTHITGLDASPRSIDRARLNVPEANYVEGWAEAMPFDDQQFDLVHTSVALHEMKPAQLSKILQEVYRVLKPNGIFVLVDFHAPTNPIVIPGLYLFLFLFETETAWQLLNTDLVEQLEKVGFQESRSTLYAGGSLQVIQTRKGGG
ncbi:MAG: class I SAM-dependent methyltransferase [Cyanobacteria bacterium CRU_2_1]|nr:class I SAM-dependent methyltransferase [Cyanobacteria bacterium RU_5_0]NJR59557.1 class I SAM-dependent methyltransferase [Cyanobacteria bacterium CRU_2_1]